MLHDSLTVEEVVDSETALEFMKEASKLASSSDLEDLSERISRKTDLFVLTCSISTIVPA